MEPAEIFWADVPFSDRHESKMRPVLVLYVPTEGDIIILPGTSKRKDDFELIAEIDFDQPRYQRISVKGTTYFYLAGLKKLPRNCFKT